MYRNRFGVGSEKLNGGSGTGRGGYLSHHDTLTNKDGIADFVASMDDGGGLLVAIDAPTLVPNTTGRRPCEAVLSRCLRSYEAGAHPANRTLLGDANGNVRGETLVALLSARFGLTHSPYLHTLPDPPRAAFEVFPHPAHVALFGLTKTLKYKKKPGRDRTFRDAEFRRYVAYLKGLADAVPELHVPAVLLPDPATFATETALKRYEDFLDAVTCAYVAAYHHRWHGDRSVVVGDLTHGYIVTPATGEMRACFCAS